MAASPYIKAALFLIRLIATAFLLCGLFLYYDDLYLWLSGKPPHPILVLALKAVPMLVGLAVFWKSRAIAERLTRDLD
jgi:hypothetical protein